jgi:hypothetical protein
MSNLRMVKSNVCEGQKERKYLLSAQSCNLEKVSAIYCNNFFAIYYYGQPCIKRLTRMDSPIQVL